MANFTQPELRQLLRSVGMTKARARIGAAIALCESPAYTDPPSSDSDAVGDQALANDTWGYSYGLWQVRSLRVHKGTGEYRDEDRLLDPEFNAVSARIIYNYAGWKAWSTYTSGAYKAYLEPPPEGYYYVIAGDSPSEIAAKFNYAFTWEELMRVNGIHAPYTIYAGQLLLLPS